MKIGEYGIVFQPMFFSDSNSYTKLSDCVAFLLSKRNKNTQDYQLSVKVIYNNKSQGFLQIKIVYDIIYVHLLKSKFSDRGNDAFLSKLMEALPEMEDHGKILTGIINI